MIRIFIVSAISALALAGCAGEDATSDNTAAAIGPIQDYASIGLYDGYYGPIRGGYWSADGSFWFLDGNNAWHRDVDGHFRHNSGADHL